MSSDGIEPVDRLLIFDCDGVLVDSEPISNRVMAEAVERLGVAMTPSEVATSFQGRRLEEMARDVEARLGDRLPSGWLSDFQLARARAFEEELRPIAGVEDVLIELDRRHLPRCVASQAGPEKIELTLGLTGLRRYFAPDALFSASMVPRPKPHPDLFLHAAAALGFAAERCVVIEDGALGVAAARAAGMQVLGFADGPAGDALAAGGAELFTSMQELPQILAL